jgi:hypothetical protein
MPKAYTNLPAARKRCIVMTYKREATMDEPMFDVQQDEPCETETCERCGQSGPGPIDRLRVSGWLAYDGLSVTHEPLHVRICPACQRKTQEELR